MLAIVIAVLASVPVGGVLAYTNVKEQANVLQADLLSHLQAGQTELEAAKTSLKQANTNHDQALIAQANVHFTTARVEFMVARQMADTSTLLQRLEMVPQIGEMARSRHVAVDAIADVGVAIADAGKELADLDGQLVKPAVKGQEAKTLLTVLNQTKASLVKVRADFVVAKAAAARVDVQVLPVSQRAGFVKAKGSLDAALLAMDEFDRLVPVITELVGGNGPRTYLVEQVNPGELRPGGGFIGTFSVIQANQGTVKLIRSGRGPDLSYPRALPGEAGYVLPPGPFRQWLPTTSWSFQDSNFFPDFPANAQAAMNFVQPKLAIHVDGVIAIDIYAAEKLLTLTGGLSVPGYGNIHGGNLISELLKHDLAQDGVDKVILSAISGPLMDRIATLPADRWPALITSLNDLATARHLQAYFVNPTVQKEIDRVGWSGVLNPKGAKDYMMEVESNLGGNKSNYFTSRHYTVELTRNGQMLHHAVIVDLMNDTPYALRPNEYYSAYVRLFVGGTASQPANNLSRPWYAGPAPPGGLKMSEGWMPTLHGYHHGAQFAFEYDTPWQTNSRGEDQIYWQKQPGTVVDVVDVIWHDGSGRTFKVSGDLAQDRIITLSGRGVAITAGQTGQATMPSLSLG